MTEKYTLIVGWCEQDKEWVVLCRAFPGFSVFGETRLEAVEEAITVLQMYVESYKERGLPLPPDVE